MKNPECILFLDIDGVLNSDDWLFENGSLTCDPVNVSGLNRIISETDAGIIVSSDWRKWMSWSDLCTRLFSAGVESEFLGKTPVIDRDTPHGDLPHRGREIDGWLRAESYDGTYVILDDRGDMEPHMHRLVQTHYDHGLTETEVLRAVALMKGYPLPGLKGCADDEL